MIRFILTLLWAVLFLIASIPIFLVEWILGKFNMRAKNYSSLRIVQWALGVVRWISGAKVTILGKENIPKEAALYVANHRSIFDIVFTYPLFKNPIGFVAKKSVEKVPLLNLWMRYLYCLFLDRDDIKAGLKMVLDAIAQVKDGISVFVFPEGTRNKGEEGSLLPFKEGTFKIATKSGCPIIPISINNAVNVWEAQFPRIKKSHVVIEFGEPILPSTLDKEEQKRLGAMCQDRIQTMLEKNANLV